MITRRSAFAVLAASLVAPVVASAQPGGLPSSTAPSNSQGTPSGGTGVIATTPVERPATPTRVKRRRRTRTRHTRSTTAQ